MQLGDKFAKKAKTRKDFTKKDIENLGKVKKLLGNQATEQMGTFEESWGGGKPLKAGQKAPSQQWVEENRVMQPRDKKGRFTYNAVNLKDLKYKASRGKTPMPFLNKEKFKELFSRSEVLVVNENNRQKIIAHADFSTLFKALKEYDEANGFNIETSTKRGRYSKEEKATQIKLRDSNGDVRIVNTEKLNECYQKQKNKK